MRRAVARLLIVSPNFPPINTPDVHRVRLSLPYYRQFGWQPSVLCVDPAFCGGVDDPTLAHSFPEGMAVTRIHPWPATVCRWFGLRHLAYRSLLPLYRAGTQLLRRERHDVVLFSTTLFLALVLGPLWKRRFGCRIVYDFQDPWYDERLSYTPKTAPGGWWKYRLDRFLARYLERFAISAADHLIVVSPGYQGALLRRYPSLSPMMFTVMPFPAAVEDRDLAATTGAAGDAFRADRPLRHWVSVAAYTPSMRPVLEAFLAIVAEFRCREPEMLADLRLQFVGTAYAATEQNRKRVEAVAQELGVADIVAESPGRLPYFDALSLQLASDAIIMVGSTEADYVASKLLNCVLCNRPILAMFHKRSLVSELAPRFPNVFLATFDETPAEGAFRSRVAEGIAWLCTTPRFDPMTIRAAIAPFSAESSTRQQCAIFDCLLHLESQAARHAEPQTTAMDE